LSRADKKERCWGVGRTIQKGMAQKDGKWWKDQTKGPKKRGETMDPTEKTEYAN